MQATPSHHTAGQLMAEKRGWLPTDTPQTCLRMLYASNLDAEQETKWGQILSHYDFNKDALLNVSDGQRLISAIMMSQLSLSPAKQISAIAEHRQRLRAGHLRRSDDVETITALVRLSVGQPICDDTDVERIHFAYEHLKANHWWPAGAEDLPFCSLLVASPGDVNKRLINIEQIFLVLSEHDEVPNNALDLVVLALNGQGDSLDVMLQRIAHLRTNLILSGIAMTEADDNNILRLAVCDDDPDALMLRYIELREQFRALLPVASPSLADQCAADAIVCRRASQIATFYRAAVAIDAWFCNRGANALWSWSPSPIS